MNVVQISDVSYQLAKVSDRIMALSNSTQPISGVYEDMLLDEISHVQILALELTKLATGDGRTDDGSAFAEGELNSNISKDEE